jgi:hypothetical protein
MIRPDISGIVRPRSGGTDDHRRSGDTRCGAQFPLNPGWVRNALSDVESSWRRRPPTGPRTVASTQALCGAVVSGVAEHIHNLARGWRVRGEPSGDDVCGPHARRSGSVGGRRARPPRRCARSCPARVRHHCARHQASFTACYSPYEQTSVDLELVRYLDRTMADWSPVRWRLSTDVRPALLSSVEPGSPGPGVICLSRCWSAV